MVVLRGGAVAYELDTPVRIREPGLVLSLALPQTGLQSILWTWAFTNPPMCEHPSICERHRTRSQRLNPLFRSFSLRIGELAFWTFSDEFSRCSGRELFRFPSSFRFSFRNGTKSPHP